MYTSVYANEIPELLQQLAKTPEMMRLSDIGMHCGCEYAGLPLYKQERFRYTRLMHSIGVASIVWNFTDDIRQAIAGLLHDIATPVFAHTIDFMNNDYLAQESTENETRSIINNSTAIKALLDRHGIKTDDISDYHKYPIADNDTPMLSADRLEYTLGNAYIVYNMELGHIKAMYDDLSVVENELGDSELCFRSLHTAKKFVEVSLRNSRFYVSGEDRFAMQLLSDVLRRAIKGGVLTTDDLYSTESKVIKKLEEHRELSKIWENYTNIFRVCVSEHEINDRYCMKVSAKKRYIDPLVMIDNNAERISKVDANTKAGIDSFLSLDFNEWLYAPDTQRRDSRS